MKAACKDHFEICSSMECDILAGERGPSYTDISQMKNLNLLHVRFIEPRDKQKSPSQKRSRNLLPFSAATSVSHWAIWQTNCSKERRSVNQGGRIFYPRNWLDPFEAQLSVEHRRICWGWIPECIPCYWA